MNPELPPSLHQKFLPHESMDSTCVTEVIARSPASASPQRQEQLPVLGPKYSAISKLGQGGMGAVYLGVDNTTNERVAIKILPAQAVSDEHAWQRFEKEARLLAEVRHPNVANLLDTGVVDHMRFLVMELVEGMDLRSVIQSVRLLPERTALCIIAGIAEALSVAHDRGVVHRDIKPANILLGAMQGTSAAAEQVVLETVASNGPLIVKLTDFGLARHIDQAASLELTRTGMMLGTPYYISPEQCADKVRITPSADIYSLGATLFEMLTGRPPFLADDPVKLIAMHCFETAPDVRKFVPELSDGVATLIATMLQKHPESRYADAAQLLKDVSRLLSGEVTSAHVHPLVPAAVGPVTDVRWEWTLKSSISALWPQISSTDRVNAALGLAAVEYTTTKDEHGFSRRFGSFRLGWTRLEWEEHPFEWIEGRRFSILREFRNGPFQWFLSVVEMTPLPQGGTHLTHSVRIAVRGLPGRFLAWLELQVKGRKSLDQLYRRIDNVISGRLTEGRLTDPFSAPHSASAALRRKLAALGTRLEQRCKDRSCIGVLLELLAGSPAQELARIRPRVLAERLKVDETTFTVTCLEACQVGLLELHWDVLCPTCRSAASVKDSLREIHEHEHCSACDRDFDVNFASTVELIFRVHPEVRTADLKTYCLGGPDHAPHVVAQMQVAQGESLEFDLSLDVGNYVLRSSQLPYTVSLSVATFDGVRRLFLNLAKDQALQRPVRMLAGRLVITIENHFQHPLVLRLERTAARRGAVTATEAMKLPEFRQLFPGEVTTRDQLSTAATTTILALRVCNVLELFDVLGDAETSSCMKNSLSECRAIVEAHGGKMARENDDRLLAVFSQVDGALNAALQIHNPCESETDDCVPKFQVALHRGVALSTSIDGRAEVFGRSLAQANAMSDGSDRPVLLLSEDLKDDPDCQEILRCQSLAASPAANRAGVGSFIVGSQITEDAKGVQADHRSPRTLQGMRRDVDVERLRP